jgi:DNA-binding NarL/FixJ family response regulator
VPIRVLLADDQAMVRAGFRSLLSSEPDIEVTAEAADGAAALAAARRHTPDVVLMDIRMPVLDGLAATRRIVATGSPSRIVILTTFDHDEYVYEALRAGASGFLLKDAPACDLIDAVRVVAAGDALLAPSVTRRVIAAFAALPRPDTSRTAQLQRLTRREVQVLRLLARGLSNPEIATALVVSDATAKTHVSNVLAKLNLRDRIQAVIYAYESGIVTPGEHE